MTDYALGAAIGLAVVTCVFVFLRWYHARITLETTRAIMGEIQRAAIIENLAGQGTLPCPFCDVPVNIRQEGHIKLEVVADGFVELNLPRTVAPGETLDMTFAHASCWQARLREIEL